MITPLQEIDNYLALIEAKVRALTYPPERVRLCAQVTERLSATMSRLGASGERGRSASMAIEILGLAEAAVRCDMEPSALENLARTWRRGQEG